MSPHNDSQPTRDQLSAGGVVYRADGTGVIEVVIITHRSGEPWRLPKGRVERGESLEDAARREAREETGLEAEIVDDLKPIDYWFWWRENEQRVRYHKTVHFFLMRCLSGDIADHDAEVEDVRWLPIAQAREAVGYREEQEVIALAEERLKARGA